MSILELPWIVMKHCQNNNRMFCNMIEVPRFDMLTFPSLNTLIPLTPLFHLSSSADGWYKLFVWSCSGPPSSCKRLRGGGSGLWCNCYHTTSVGIWRRASFTALVSSPPNSREVGCVAKYAGRRNYYILQLAALSIFSNKNKSLILG